MRAKTEPAKPASSGRLVILKCTAGRAKAQHDPSLSELHDGPITRYPSGRYHGNGRHRQTPTGPSKL